MLAVALSHGLGGGDGRLFHHAQKLQRQVGFQVCGWRVFHSRFFGLNFGRHVASGDAAACGAGIVCCSGASPRAYSVCRRTEQATLARTWYPANGKHTARASVLPSNFRSGVETVYSAYGKLQRAFHGCFHHFHAFGSQPSQRRISNRLLFYRRRLITFHPGIAASGHHPRPSVLPALKMSCAGLWRSAGHTRRVNERLKHRWRGPGQAVAYPDQADRRRRVADTNRLAWYRAATLSFAYPGSQTGPLERSSFFTVLSGHCQKNPPPLCID